MAMTSPAPKSTRPKEIFSKKTARVALKFVPDISDGKQADRRYFATSVTIFGIIGLLFLLLINTLLTQDAFELSNLKTQAKFVSDQREAITRQIDSISSPESLAKAAFALGMKPTETPIFLALDKVIQEPSVKNG